jgi:UDP-N-acetylmuramoyl-tripeptide--D-alanyl-D-alanine ligase
MAELGPAAEEFHREIGVLARDGGLDLLIGVGRLASAYDPDELVADAAEAGELLEQTIQPGDVVLVKGSRSVGLEAVAERLQGAEDDPA